MLFDEFDRIPEGLLDIPARAIKAICPRPTLLHLAGRRESLDVNAKHRGNPARLPWLSHGTLASTDGSIVKNNAKDARSERLP